MSPEVKKVLSGLLVAVAAAVIGVLQTYVVHLPPEVAGFAGSLLVGVAHYVNAYGHADQVEVAAQDKAVDMITEIVNREP